jgi:Gluconate 2-dehydrogenase subunit 3
MPSDPPDSRGLTRRGFLGGATLLPLLGIVPGLLDIARAAPADAAYSFFSPHQAAVIDAATRRLVPGPDDDPAEAGHPGAHEAGVVRYLDTMLAAFTFSPPKLFAGGPWSDRQAPGGPDYLATFVPPDPAQELAWQQRIAQLHKEYTAGIALLDSEAGGDFTSISAPEQDRVLASDALAGFTPLLFGHTIEGMYSIPEYGGNAGRVGWIEIGYPGDSQPRGYTAEELAEQQISILDPVGITGQVLEAFPQVAAAMVAGRRRHAR